MAGDAVDGVVASEERSVLALIAIAVFGSSSIGFYIVQVFTAAILILAANTAYQDFPRLASILARDRYMPRQFVNRGDRLVFSNGVVALGLFSCVMIYIFNADLNTLIHFYVVGVFTSFTLSQSGMVVHWIRERHKGAQAATGWQRSIVINIIGGVTTAVVLVVVIISKFGDGAWLSILIIALLVPVFYAIHRHYRSTGAAVGRGLIQPRTDARHHSVLLVRDFDAAAALALGYLRSTRPDSMRIVIPATAGRGSSHAPSRGVASPATTFPISSRSGTEGCSPPSAGSCAASMWLRTTSSTWSCPRPSGVACSPICCVIET